jgi:hypothetical protein
MSRRPAMWTLADCRVAGEVWRTSAARLGRLWAANTAARASSALARSAGPARSCAPRSHASCPKLTIARAMPDYIDRCAGLNSMLAAFIRSSTLRNNPAPSHPLWRASVRSPLALAGHRRVALPRVRVPEPVQCLGQRGQHQLGLDLYRAHTDRLCRPGA